MPITQLTPRHDIGVARPAERVPDLPPGSDPIPERHRWLPCRRRHSVALTAQARYPTWKNNKAFGPKAVRLSNQPARRPLITSFGAQISRASARSTAPASTWASAA
ncbi:MAG TPA: hypothetical protein VGJ95_24630, partial [Pseudonocardiaceae bacterium]